jgi:DNA-binding MarR family transcriptional regulator
VLGAVALAGQPLPVAEIARRMGLARQSVQRTADDLARGGLVAYHPNPRHKRAKLVALTEAGEAAYAAAMARHDPWAAGLAAGIDPTDLARAVAVMQAIGARLDAEPDPAAVPPAPTPAAPDTS